MANGVAHANAHDALSDVLATIEMARLVKNAQPKLFEYLFDLRNKNKVKALIDVVTMKPWCTSPACSPLAGVQAGVAARLAPHQPERGDHGGSDP